MDVPMKMRRKRLARRGFWLILLLLPVLVLYLACSARPVKVGAVLPLTGPMSSFGLSMQNAMKVAQRQVNDGGGISGRPLEILYKDSGGLPGRASDSARQLVEKEGIFVLIGADTSADVLAMVPLTRDGRCLLLSPSASTPKLTGAGDYVFRNWPSDTLEAKVMADFAAYTLHATRLLAVSQKGEYGDGLFMAFAGRFSGDRRRVSKMSFEPGAEPSAILARRIKMQMNKAQVLYLIGYPHSIVPLVRALREAGVDQPILSVSSLAGSPEVETLGAEGRGLLFPRPEWNPDSSSSGVSRFVSDYKKRFKKTPDVYAAHAYDAVRILARVMSAGRMRPARIREGLLDLGDYAGVSGKTTFDKQGDVSQPFQVCVVWNGRVAPLSSVRQNVLPQLQHLVDALRFGS